MCALWRFRVPSSGKGIKTETFLIINNNSYSTHTYEDSYIIKKNLLSIIHSRGARSQSREGISALFLITY